MKMEYDKLKMKQMKEQGIQTDPTKIKTTVDKMEQLRKEMRTKEQHIFEVKMELKKQQEQQA